MVMFSRRNDCGSAFEETAVTSCREKLPVTFLCFYFSIHSFVAGWDRSEVSPQLELDSALSRQMCLLIPRAHQWMCWINVLHAA